MKKIIKNKKIIKENKIKKINEKNEVVGGVGVNPAPMTLDAAKYAMRVLDGPKDGATQSDDKDKPESTEETSEETEQEKRELEEEEKAKKEKQEQEKNKEDIRKLLLEFKRELETAAKTDESECYKEYVSIINKDKYIDNLKEKYISILKDIVNKFMDGGNIKESINNSNVKEKINNLNSEDKCIDETLKYIFKNIEEDYNFEGLNKYKDHVKNVLDDYNKEIENINNDIYFSNKQIKDDMINKIKDLKQKQINLALQCGVEKEELEEYIEDDQNYEGILRDEDGNIINLKQQLDSYIKEINDKLNEINNINELGLVKLSYRDEYQDIVNQLNEKIEKLIKQYNNKEK